MSRTALNVRRIEFRSRKIHFRIVGTEYLVIVVSSTKRLASSFASAAGGRGGDVVEGEKVGNARRMLQVKRDEDDWTKGSFRQMKDGGTIPKGRGPAAKEKWDRRSP